MKPFHRYTIYEEKSVECNAMPCGMHKTAVSNEGINILYLCSYYSGESLVTIGEVYTT